MARPTIEEVDSMFVEKARMALVSIGIGALEFLAANPAKSVIDLTKLLAAQSKRKLSAIGLIMAIYDEAMAKGVVRDVAKDMFVRNFFAEFPDGWTAQPKPRWEPRLGRSLTVGSRFKLGHWSLDLGKFTRDPRLQAYGWAIVRDFSVDHPPPEGWNPTPKNDSVIDELFDRLWPSP